MSKNKPVAVPTTYLPEDWREQGMEKFKLSKSSIEKAVYGSVSNPKVTKFMLELAEQGKKEHDEFQERLAAVAQ